MILNIHWIFFFSSVHFIIQKLWVKMFKLKKCRGLWMLLWRMGGDWSQALMNGTCGEHGCIWGLSYIITSTAWQQQCVTLSERAAGGVCSCWALLMDVRPVLRSAGSASAHVFRRQRKCHSPRACWEKPGVRRVSLLLSSQQIKAKRHAPFSSTLTHRGSDSLSTTQQLIWPVLERHNSIQVD